MTLVAGARLGPYEILAPLGAGGMGEVYKARDTRLGREVAIKVLPTHLSSSPEIRQRFDREARTISQLSHPHICALYDVGHQDGTDYLVMEYLEGETLADRLGRGPLPLEQTLRYGIQIAEALDKAHRQGIVHRDLKPGNVMLTKSGVKLLDFGLAKALSPTSSASALTALPTQANLTQEGTILGTFQYMAPEQLEAREADARTDIFALGCVLYEMATGRKAFSGTSQASLISAIMHNDPPLISSLQPMSPPSLDRLVRRCLAKDPERRLQNARDLALELADAAAAPGRDVAAVRPAGRASRVGWIAATALLGLLIASLLIPRRGAPADPPAKLRLTIPAPSGAALQGMLALSPDGRMLAFVATAGDGNDLLYVRPLDSLDARSLPGTEGAAFPFWSPDSRTIAFFAQSKLKRIEVAGGSPMMLSEAVEPRGGSWGSGGDIVAAIHTGGTMVRVPEGGGQSVPLRQLQPGRSYRWPEFLPDGRHFLYFVFAGTNESPAVHVASLDSKETTRLVTADGGAVYAAPGYLLYRRGDRLVGQRFDASRRALEGEPFPVVESIRWDGTATLATAVTTSDTGLLACQTGGAIVSQLLWYDRSGREMEASGPPGSYWEPTLSPDGRSLAVPRMDPETMSASIWTMDLQRGSFAPISSRAPIAATPLWSPDGRRIVYCAFPTGDVYVRDVQGAEGEKLLFRSEGFTPLDDWSRDGRFLFYETIDWPRFHFDVWVRDLKAGTSRPLLEAKFSQLGARLSPDGRWLAYESEESGAREIFVRSFPAAAERRQVSLRGGTQPRWRRDGRELFYVSPDRKLMAVAVRTDGPFEAETPRALFQTRIVPAVEARNHYDVTPDGQRFVVNSRPPGDGALPIIVLAGWAPEPKR